MSLRSAIKRHVDVLWQAAHSDDAPVSEITHSRRLFAPSDRLCGVTDTGLLRRHNEDEFYVSTDTSVLIVADGMGGEAAGEVASALATTWIASAMCAEPRGTAVDERLLEAFHEAHRAILAHAREHTECARMGSAALAASVVGDVLHLCHAGDVRCYVSGREGLNLVTADHSVVEELVRTGQITRDAAATHPARSRLQQALGVSTRFSPTVSRRPLVDGDRVLICSDGLWETLAPEELATVASSDGSMRQIATVLVDRANAAGGPDNITAVLYEHTGELP